MAAPPNEEFLATSSVTMFLLPIPFEIQGFTCHHMSLS